MNKKTNADNIHSFETAYDRAVRKMEERDALIMNQPSMRMADSINEQLRTQQESLAKALQPMQDVIQSCSNLLTSQSLGISSALASYSAATQEIVPDNITNVMSSTLSDIATAMKPYQNIYKYNSDIMSAFNSVRITPELQDLHTKLDESIGSMGNGLSAISDYIYDMTSQWNNALCISDVSERSIAAQNIAMIKMLPDYEMLPLPRGSKSVLKSLTKSAAKKIMESDEIRFDPKERKFYHKDSPDNTFSGNQITVVESSLALFADITFDELISFESKLATNYAFAFRHPVGIRIFKILQNWNHFVSFDDITYYHARPLKENQNPFYDYEMMKAPLNVSSHGRYNEVGRSCYYIAETREGSIKEISKHSGGKKITIQVIGLRPTKTVRLLDLSGEVKGTNRFIEHIRFTVENDAGRTVKEYLLPNYVASCCRELEIDGIKYRSTGYNCCVLWKDDYFEFVEGSREIIDNITDNQE